MLVDSLKSLIISSLLFMPHLFSEIPEETLKKFPPMEVIYHPVSTTNEEAQKNFDRGLANNFAYNHDIAFASFKEAAKLDPSLAMAYWGMALARGQNVNQDITPENEIRCYNYIQQALKLSGNASASEKAYINALATRYSNDPQADLIALRHRYRDAMKKVIEQYPEDLDAITLYSESILLLDPWKWWTPNGKPREGTPEAIERLQFVLGRNPDHIGANHFYIHAWEESPSPEVALMSAYRLGFIFPESGHLMHMPCHIFLPVGDYKQAVAHSKQAIALDLAYYKKVGLSGGLYPIHYLSHNYAVLARTYMLMENYDDAIKTAMELSHFIEPHIKSHPDKAHFTMVPLKILLYFGKWKEILEYKFPTDLPAEQAFWHYSRAKAFIYTGNLDRAQNEKKLMINYIKEIPKDHEIANNPAVKIMELAEVDLAADFAQAEHKDSTSILLLNFAVDLQDKLEYDEPPPWYISMRLPLGNALLKQKKYLEAKDVFQEALHLLKRNGRALTGLFLSLKGLDQTMDAYWIEREMTAALRSQTTKQ